MRYRLLYPVFFAAVFLSHLTLLRLPYFWDEAGYYIPAAWDFFRTGSLIPQTTATNAHPPLPSILLAGWWHLSGFVPSGTRTFVCMTAAAALLAVFGIGRKLLGTGAGAALAILTAVYPVWFAQSTLAHADIFAAAFTLWGLLVYLGAAAEGDAPTGRDRVYTAVLFSLSVLAKETAMVTSAALALWEGFQAVRERAEPERARFHAKWAAVLLFPALPLAGWYAYHFHKTGFIFGNPEFLRYNATANLDAHRIALCLYHRLLHLTMHMNMFVPTVCTLAALLLPAISGRGRLSRRVSSAVVVVLVANWIAFSVLGGALLTRYLLPMYPLVLLLCVAEWQRRFFRWEWIAVLSAAGFLAGIWINPPYAFAPEDNLTYRNFVVLHQRAVSLIAHKWPKATVLTAWPAGAELERPELGYTKTPVKAFAIRNFSFEEMQKAAAAPGEYDTALLFSTKLAPVGPFNMSKRNESSDTRYFDFHQDVPPQAAAAMLHGEVVWQQSQHGEWVAVLRFPRVVNAIFARALGMRQRFACEADFSGEYLQHLKRKRGLCVHKLDELVGCDDLDLGAGEHFGSQRIRLRCNDGGNAEQRSGRGADGENVVSMHGEQDFSFVDQVDGSGRFALPEEHGPRDRPGALLQLGRKLRGSYKCMAQFDH